MKLNGFSATFKIQRAGDTGYSNKSSLSIFTKRGGKTIFPYARWEESDFPNLEMVVKIELKIPSGLLLIKK